METKMGVEYGHPVIYRGGHHAIICVDSHHFLVNTDLIDAGKDAWAVKESRGLCAQHWAGGCPSKKVEKQNIL